MCSRQYFETIPIGRTCLRAFRERQDAELELELEAQDRQRREMVANVSHDLRTPLTHLHGYLETLITGIGSRHGAKTELSYNIVYENGWGGITVEREEDGILYPHRWVFSRKGIGALQPK